MSLLTIYRATFRNGFLLAALIALCACGDNKPGGQNSERPSHSSTPRAAASTLPAPQTSGPVEGGIRGRPWAGTSENLAPLAPFDFIQEEYFFTATANSRTANAETTGSVAGFASRLLVQRPRLPENFNGTVFIEWLNVTGQMEQSVLWALNYSELLREGYAYVAVSVQETGVSTSPLAIKYWDPVRYAPLSHPGDAYAFDIFSLASRALFAHDGPAPLGDLVPQRVIAAGESQSAGWLIAYANHMQPVHRVFDGFLIHSYTGPISEVVDVPVMMILTETELEGFTSPQSPIYQGADNPVRVLFRDLPGFGIARTPEAEAPSADHRHLRVWEIAGASHYDQQSLDYSMDASGQDFSAPFENNYALQLPLLCGKPINQLAMHRPTRAALHALNDWMQTGQAPALVPRVERNEDGSVVRNADGLARGGLRVPPMIVPVGVNTGDDCVLFGSYTAYSDDKIRSLYPSKAEYQDQVLDAAATNVTKGWLLPPEAEAYVQEAMQLDIWEE